MGFRPFSFGFSFSNHFKNLGERKQYDFFLAIFLSSALLYTRQEASDSRIYYELTETHTHAAVLPSPTNKLKLYISAQIRERLQKTD